MSWNVPRIHVKMEDLAWKAPTNTRVYVLTDIQEHVVGLKPTNVNLIHVKTMEDATIDWQATTVNVHLNMRGSIAMNVSKHVLYLQVNAPIFITCVNILHWFKAFT